MSKYWCRLPELIMFCGLVAALGGCLEKKDQSQARTGENTAKTGVKTMKTEKATFGGGCFWGVELEFANVPGVVSTAVGYEGGKTKSPSYKDVCTDTTGHAEVVELEFDPTQVAYDKLLDVFFEVHDPTQVNRQGPDVGEQYRTVIFYHTPQQESAANVKIEQLNKSGKFRRPIATKVVPAETFWKAEDYHQQYLAKRGKTSCHVKG